MRLCERNPSVVGQSGGHGQRRRRIRRPARFGLALGALAVMLAAPVATQAGGPYHGPHGGYSWGHYRGPHWGPGWRGSSFGVVVGVPLVGSYLGPGPFYDWPYSWPARTLIVEAPRTAYIERDAPPADGGAAADWWYYCRSPRGYYPDVARCPQGWERVPPRSD